MRLGSLLHVPVVVHHDDIHFPKARFGKTNLHQTAGEEDPAQQNVSSQTACNEHLHMGATPPQLHMTGIPHVQNCKATKKVVQPKPYWPYRLHGWYWSHRPCSIDRNGPPSANQPSRANTAMCFTLWVTPTPLYMLMQNLAISAPKVVRS